MKTLSLLLLLLLTLFTSSCTKKEPIKPSENPINTFTAAGSISKTTVNNGRYELGYYFSAAVPGKVTQLGAKMPEAGTYTITLWDVATKAVLRQKTLELGTPDKLIFEAIDPVEVTDNTKKYAVTINNIAAGVTRKYDLWKTTAGGSFMPFVQGNILVHGSYASAIPTSSTASVFPITYAYTDVLLSSVDFTFMPN